MQYLKSHFVGEWEIIGSRPYYCTNLRYYRKIRTHQERTMYGLHHTEYRHVRQLKLRAKRGKALPCTWHDIRVFTLSCTKSWKHNSKRPR